MNIIEEVIGFVIGLLLFCMAVSTIIIFYALSVCLFFIMLPFVLIGLLVGHIITYL